jgi:exodeoxyribonuclease-3
MSPETLKVATYNCNSIRARLQLVLDWLDRERPDALCLQATKTEDSEFPSDVFQDLGYYVTFRGQKAHAGVAVLSIEKPEEVSFGLDDGEAPDEPRLVRTELAGIALINTYVPQGRSVDSPYFQYKLQWLHRIRAYFERHYIPGDLLVWAGDFNVAPEPADVYDPERLAKHVDFHPDGRQALEEVRAWGLVDVFRMHHPDEPEQYTFWDYRVPSALERGMGWRLDHIWATKPLAERSTRAWIDVDARRAQKPSDHTFLVVEFAL